MPLTHAIGRYNVEWREPGRVIAFSRHCQSRARGRFRTSNRYCCQRLTWRVVVVADFLGCIVADRRSVVVFVFIDLGIEILIGIIGIIGVHSCALPALPGFFQRDARPETLALDSDDRVSGPYVDPFSIRRRPARRSTTRGRCWVYPW